MRQNSICGNRTEVMILRMMTFMRMILKMMMMMMTFMRMILKIMMMMMTGKMRNRNKGANPNNELNSLLACGFLY